MILRSLGTLLLLILAVSLAAVACTCSPSTPGKCPGLQPGDVVFLGTVMSSETVPSAFPAEALAKEGAPAEASPKDGLPAEAPSTDVASSERSAKAEMPITSYHFRVDERFAGAFAPDIDIFSGGEDGDCGFRFETGAQYVVFTHQGNDGRLYATICSGTRPAGDARALLPQLRAMRDGRRVASVFGILRRSDPPFLAPPPDPPADPSADPPADSPIGADAPLGNVSLHLRSRDDRFETSTGADGVYSFYDVHAGEYAFTARLPARMELTQKTLIGGLPPFKIPNGACFEYNVDALPTGHLHGSVLGPNGKPLALASLELYRAGAYSDNRPGLWSFQGALGVFDFDHIGPGTYIIVFNRTSRLDPNSPFPRAFYPGVADVSDARPIKLEDGEELLNLKFKLHAGYPVRSLRVRLKWQGGRPPGSVTVIAKADQGDNPAAQKIADGLYKFTLLESANYTISAWEDLTPRRATSRPGEADCAAPARIEAPPITVSGSDRTTKEVALVLSLPACPAQ